MQPGENLTDKELKIIFEKIPPSEKVRIKRIYAEKVELDQMIQEKKKKEDESARLAELKKYNSQQEKEKIEVEEDDELELYALKRS